MLTKTLLVVAAFVTGALTACTSSGTTGPGRGVTAAKAAANSTSSSAAAGGGGSAPSTAAPKGGGAAFCSEMAAAGNALVSLGGGDPTKADPTRYEREMNQLVAAAPADIKSDLQAIGGVEVQVVKGDLGADAKLQEPAMLQHVRHFVSWMQTNCPGVLDVPSGLPPA